MYYIFFNGVLNNFSLQNHISVSAATGSWDLWLLLTFSLRIVYWDIKKLFLVAHSVCCLSTSSFRGLTRSIRLDQRNPRMLGLRARPTTPMWYLKQCSNQDSKYCCCTLDSWCMFGTLSCFRLGDKFGRRRTIAIGCIFIILGSILLSIIHCLCTKTRTTSYGKDPVPIHTFGAVFTLSIIADLDEKLFRITQTNK